MQKCFFEFGPFRVEPDDCRVTKNGQVLHLTGKPFNVLLYLLNQPPRSLVRKDQIITNVWPDTFVEDGNLSVHITKIRQTLGDEDLIQAVAKHGYRLNADVIRRSTDALPQSTPAKKRSSRSWIAASLVAVVVVAVAAYIVNRAKKQKVSPARDLYGRALAYERAGDDEQARTTLDQALAIDPRFFEACVRAAFLSYELEEPGRAADYLSGCQAVINARDELVRLKAQALKETINDNRGRALELLQLMRDKYPKDADGLFRFSELATDLGRIEEAEDAASRCIRLEVDNPYCQFQLMYIRIKQNRFDDVISAVSSLPSSVRSYPWLDEPIGVALLAKGDIEGATRAFRSLETRQARLHGTAFFTVAKEWNADVLLYQGRIDEFGRRIEQLMETADNSSAKSAYLAYLAHVNALVENRDKAREFAIRSVDTSPDASSLTQAAIVTASTGDSAGTERLLATRLLKAGAPLSPKTDHLIRGLLAEAKGDHQLGIEELTMAHDLDPNDHLVSYWLGNLYLRSGELGRALPLFESVKNAKGTILLDDAPVLIPLVEYRLAQCYEGLGDQSSAKAQYLDLNTTWALADPSLTSKFRVKMASSAGQISR